MTTALLEDPQLRQWSRDFWFSGDLDFLLRAGAQRQLVDALNAPRPGGVETVEPIVAKVHRRAGKSYGCLVDAAQHCLRTPGLRVGFGAPTYEMVRGIVQPNLNLVLRTCPAELRPRQSGYTYTFVNPAWPAGSQPSVLEIVGCDYRDGDMLRGAWKDRVYLDEAGLIKNLRYLVESVLLYQFAGRPHPLLAIVSTPPRSADHEFESYFVEQARRVDRYLEIPVTSNPFWTDRDDQMLSEAIGGGKESISWRREALCEAVSDESELIVPEFQRNESTIVVDEYPRPSHFYPHTCLDTGWNDWNAALCGYVDFNEQVLVVEDELVMRYQSTGTIGRGIEAKERALWKGEGDSWTPGHRPSRMGDLTEQALEDLRVDHGVFVRAVEKYDREAAIANLRTSIQNGKVRIHRCCKNLTYQMRNGVWNKARTQFERSERMGHLDALAALVYLHRMANWRGNPFPDPEYNLDVMMPPVRKQKNRWKELAEAFGQ